MKRLLLLGMVAAAPPAVEGQAPPDSLRSARSGAYTVSQAARGREVYAMSCASCHTAASHTGAVFAARWDGLPLWELFRYVSTSMPKSEPGSLTEREYTRVVAYLLKMNDLPAGQEELLADSTALKRIRIDLKPR